MKKIIFLDGDGTLWYPKATKYSEAPHWVYKNPKTASNPNIHLVPTPAIYSTLKKLREKGVITIILSTHPHPPEEANSLLLEKVKYFKMENLFDEIHATRGYFESKGEYILKILKRRKIPKKYALMIGDQYLWDYKPARDSGIDALLIDSEYRKSSPGGKRIKKTIKQLKNILEHHLLTR